MAVAEKPKFTFLVFVVLFHNGNVLLLIVPLSVSLRNGFYPQRIVYRLMAAALPCVCLSIARTSRLIILLGRVRRLFLKGLLCPEVACGLSPFDYLAKEPHRSCHFH